MTLSSGSEPRAIALAGLAKQYRPGWFGKGFHALHPLTLQLPRGQVLGLLGPNGSGKSTTLKLLAGLIAPTAGRALILGKEAGSAGARALVGYLPESPQFSPHLSAREFLEYCAGLSGMDPAAARARIAELLVWAGLVEAEGKRIATFSKGMTQRLGLAQAILHRPPVLLLDEPASGLDPEGRLALGNLICDLAAQGCAVVMSSHLLPQAAEWCDRIAILGRGRLLAEGSTQELLGLPRMPAVGPSALEKLYLEKVGSA